MRILLILLLAGTNMLAQPGRRVAALAAYDTAGAGSDAGGSSSITDSLTLDATWTVVGQERSELSGAITATMEIELNIAPGDTGIILEAGGGSKGLLLYAWRDTVYFQCGDGASWSGSSTGEVKWPISGSGTRTFVISADASQTGSGTDLVNLYVDNVLVDSENFGYTEIAGNNGGALGDSNGNNVTNRAGFQQGDQYSGSITHAKIYLDETVF